MRTSWLGSSAPAQADADPLPAGFEQLEGRTMLSGVTTQAALILAINTANATPGAHSITLGADITLHTVNNMNDGPNGLPYIKSGDNLTIVGNGHVIQRSTSSGDAAFRLFDVASGASLNLKNMSLENGLVSGPAAATLQGGAIFVESGGNLSLDRVTLSGNSVNNAGSAPKHIGRRRDLQRGDRDDCQQRRDGQLRCVQSHQRRRPGRQQRPRQRQWQRSYWGRRCRGGRHLQCRQLVHHLQPRRP